jgi:8-oxoguanine deaminase
MPNDRKRRSASNDSSNLMQEVRLACLLQRVGKRSTAFGHKDALRLATEGSARCLGRDDIGRLEVGRQADLALFKLDEPRFSGHGDPLAALVLCGAHRADRVMVAGRWLVADGALVSVDLPRLLEDHARAARRLQQQA